MDFRHIECLPYADSDSNTDSNTNTNTNTNTDPDPDADTYTDTNANGRLQTRWSHFQCRKRALLRRLRQ